MSCSQVTVKCFWQAELLKGDCGEESVLPGQWAKWCLEQFLSPAKEASLDCIFYEGSGLFSSQGSAPKSNSPQAPISRGGGQLLPKFNFKFPC